MTESGVRYPKEPAGRTPDQGAHLIDLAKWILDDFAEVSGYVETHFWDMEPLEDNAYGIFRTVSGQIASLHVSWTQWKNLFSFEVHGRDGYAIAEGLGGRMAPNRLGLVAAGPKEGLQRRRYCHLPVKMSRGRWSGRISWPVLKDGASPCTRRGGTRDARMGLQAIRSGAEATGRRCWICSK